MEGLIAVTYRCNAHCHMCDTWQFPTRVDEEVTAADLRTLPRLSFANIRGGEPFLRSDLAEIVEVVRSKADRVVISTNGYFTDRIIALAEKYPGLGFRVSLEGLLAANDELRGIEDGFDHGLRTLLRLRALGVQFSSGVMCTVFRRRRHFNQEIKRRTRVVRISPNEQSCLRLVSALCAGTSEEWMTDRRFVDIDRLIRAHAAHDYQNVFENTVAVASGQGVVIGPGYTDA